MHSGRRADVLSIQPSSHVYASPRTTARVQKEPKVLPSLLDLTLPSTACSAMAHYGSSRSQLLSPQHVASVRVDPASQRISPSCAKSLDGQATQRPSEEAQRRLPAAAALTTHMMLVRARCRSEIELQA